MVTTPRIIVQDRVSNTIAGDPGVDSRGRAATCLHEKVTLARGHGSFSLGTYCGGPIDAAMNLWGKIGTGIGPAKQLTFLNLWLFLPQRLAHTNV